MRAARTAWTVAGTRMLASGAGQAVGAALADQRAGLDQRRGRSPPGRTGCPRSARSAAPSAARSDGSSPSSAGQQLVGALGRQRVDPELGVVALAAPGVAVLRAVVDQQQDPGGRQALDQAVEQRLGLGVDPVQVLEDQQQRLLLALAQQQPLDARRGSGGAAGPGRAPSQAASSTGDVEQGQQRRQDRRQRPVERQQLAGQLLADRPRVVARPRSGSSS